MRMRCGGEVRSMKGNLAGIPAEEFERLQHRLDIEKWLASEQAGRRAGARTKPPPDGFVPGRVEVSWW